MSGKQLSLFGEPAPVKQGTDADVRASAEAIKRLARRNDPDTSRIAAERMVESGQLTVNQTRVYAALRDMADEAGSTFGGATYAEIAAYAVMDRHEAARRLPELERAQLVKRGDGKRCSVKQSLMQTWWPVKE